MSKTGKAYGNVPVNSALLPVSKSTYSEWILKQMDAQLLQENPSQTGPQVKDNKDIYWESFADWAAKNTVKLSDSLFLYMEDNDNWIFKFFPLKSSKATRYMQQNMEINQQFSKIETRKVPFRQISATVTNREGHAVYFPQGFSMDYHFMKTPDGRVAWDRMVDAITANFWSVIYYNAMNEMLFEPSFYRRENQLYPFDSVPRNANELFDYEQRKMFIINKQPQAFHMIIADAARVMSQKQETCTGLVVTRDDLWFAHGRDPTQCFYDKSGPVSLKSRSSAGQETVIDGATIYPVPLCSGRLHDSTFTRILEYPIQLGSFVLFPELTQKLSADEYTSEKRSIRFASSTRNSMTKYTLLDVLKHVPEFIPLDNESHQNGSVSFADDNDNDDDDDSECSSLNGDSTQPHQGGSKMAGKINKSLLYRMIDNREGVFRNRMQTKLTGNEDRLSVLIKYNNDPSLSDEQRYYPIMMFGEIAESNMKTKYLGHVYRTMENAMFMGISKEEISMLEKGIEYAHLRRVSIGDFLDNIESDNFDYGKEDMIKNTVRIFKKVVSNMQVCCHGHIALSPKMVPSRYNTEKMATQTKVLIAAWTVLTGQYYTDGYMDEDSKMFGGSIFTALFDIDSRLPSIEKSGNITDSLRSRPEIGQTFAGSTGKHRNNGINIKDNAKKIGRAHV